MDRDVPERDAAGGVSPVNRPDERRDGEWPSRRFLHGEDVPGDVGDGGEPEAGGGVVGVLAGFEQDFGFDGLEAARADVVADEDEPAAFAGGDVHETVDLGEGELVVAGAHEVGEVADGGIVGGLVEVAAAAEEALGDEGDVAFEVGAAADVGLAARVGEADGGEGEQVLDLLGGAVEVAFHAGEVPGFEGVFTGEGVVAGAGVGVGVVADFVAGFGGGAPIGGAFADAVGRDIEGGAGPGAFEQGEAGIELGRAGVVEGEADGAAFAVGPGSGESGGGGEKLAAVERG